MAFESLLNGELEGIITAHLTDLNIYLPHASYQIQVPKDLLHLLTRLDRLTSTIPEYSSHQQDEVLELIHRLESFLHQMNVTLDEAFGETIVGRIWLRAHHWYQAVGYSPIKLPPTVVWDRLKPAMPDCLERTANGGYMAKWWKPYPVMDVEILMRTEGIRVQGEPFEPGDLPGGLAVCFWVI